MSAASDALAARIRPLIGHLPVEEEKMFGGMGFMLNGNMVVGVSAKGMMMVRVDPDAQEAALKMPGAAPMHMGPRLMKGFIGVEDKAIKTDKALKDWIAFAHKYVATLPEKAK